MQQIQRDIAQALQVQPPFQSEADVQAQIARRIAFIQQCLKDSGLKTLVLGISGGVDSLTAGLLAQRAVEQLREQTGDQAYRFIAVRLPYQVQQDEADAQASLATIRADEEQTVNIGPSVKALAEQLEALEGLEPAKSDFVIGNIKARIRMVAQYAIAGARGGLVIGTDHAAEAVMGFFTKFGDGACDLAPLSGLAKHQVRALARALGAPENLVEKIPTADLEDLRPGHPDEASHGVTYAEIDAFLHGQPLREEAARVIVDTYHKTQHKRELPKAPEPPGPCGSPSSTGLCRGRECACRNQVFKSARRRARRKLYPCEGQPCAPVSPPCSSVSCWPARPADTHPRCSRRYGRSTPSATAIRTTAKASD